MALLGHRYRPALVRYFQRHTGNASDAEDLAQEALIRLCRSSKDAGNVDNIEAYLMRIASNLMRDRFRRDQSHHASQHEAFDERVHDGMGEGFGSDHVYEAKERLQRFLEALDQLSPRCRQVFLLQRYDGLTYGAIAKRLGISVSAVEKQMMRALLHFDSRLGDP